MSMTLNPYLTFTDNAREAMEFYKSALGGDLDVMTFGQMGGDPKHADGVMHAHLKTSAGFTLMASDMPPGQQAPEQSNVSVSISGDDSDTLRGYFTALSEGGKVTMPLEKQVWGDEFGMVTDKFGITWMVNIAGEAAGQSS